MALSDTAYVILGMLRLGNRTGYEIKQFVDKSTRFFWAASYGQIYPELKRLEAAGLVRSESAPHGGRRRQAYELTPEGDRALDSWLTTPDVSHYEARDLALLKLFFADGLERGAAARLARAARERHEAIAAALADVEANRPAEPDHHLPGVVLSFGLDFHRWCVERYAQMEQHLLSAEN